MGVTQSAHEAHNNPHACQSIPTLQPAVPLRCVSLFAGGGAGTLMAEVQLSGGRVVTSSSTPFTLPPRSGKSSTLSEGQSCADIVTGLFLSSALVSANKTLPSTVQQFRACNSGTKQVSLTVGPLTEEACGTYSVSFICVRAPLLQFSACCAIGCIFASVNWQQPPAAGGLQCTAVALSTTRR